MRADEEYGHWLAAYTRARFEYRVKEHCEARGIAVFLPTYRTWRQWSDRRVVQSVPLFPSYVFVCPRADERSAISQSKGFVCFVQNSLGPVRVNAAELAAIRRLLASGLAFDPLPGAELGDEMEIVAGPLRGGWGYLLRKDDRSIVLRVGAANGCVRVQIPDPTWIRPASARPRCQGVSEEPAFASGYCHA